ncbi:MAG: LacI family transcriptional regulator [Lachnospiraceae bacterium]|nr:LacI family transcriptional regulator [Lachnospiraceae bacterium]
MSLKKIAKLTGTSVSTVSRVLHQPGHTCNEPGLAEKIWETAKKMNYLPNSSARELRMGSREQISPFMVDVFLTRFASMDTDPFFQELFQHIKEELMHENCLLGEMFYPDNFMMPITEESIPSMVPYKSSEIIRKEIPAISPAFVSRKNNTGLVILGKCPEALIPVLRKKYACMVGIDRNPTDYLYDEVFCDGSAAAIKAVEYLISLGHRHIAYIGDCNFESRYIGYYQALLAHKIPLNYQNIHPSRQTLKEGYDIMCSILGAGEYLPSAIFCANDATAIGVLRALKQHKKRGYMPSVISIDNITASEKTSPMLTTISIPKKEMAHLALNLLLDRKENGHSEIIRLELPCRLIERESCS